MQVKLLKGRTNMYGIKLEDKKKTLRWNSKKTTAQNERQKFWVSCEECEFPTNLGLFSKDTNTVWSESLCAPDDYNTESYK